MIEVSNVRLPLDAGLPGNEALIERAAAQALGIRRSEIESVELLRRSVDARKGEVRFIATVAVSIRDEATEAALLALGEQPQENAVPKRSKRSRSARKKGRQREAKRASKPEASATQDSESRPESQGPSLAKGVKVKPHHAYEPLEIAPMIAPSDTARPVVVGTGPAGLFAALYLARAGLRPLVIERGGDVDERTRAVKAFDEGANLDLATNVQFGEGGAGTFSDGKLTTGTKSPLARHVLQWFVDAGAPEEILWQAKPHIGTDKLVDVVKRMRMQIQEAGGDVLFHAKLHDVVLDENGKLCEIAVSCEGAACEVLRAEQARQAAQAQQADQAQHAQQANTSQTFTIPCTTLVLACGHSARDTFRMLQRAKLAMEPKAFSIGVRIEHLQSVVDRAQYGKFAGHPALGAADYKLVAHLPSGRSVYTFCMCPGGEVVAAASEEYGVVVNGMSRFARDGKNANAALLVGVSPSDYPSSDPLAGTVFQRRIEQAAFGEAHEMGGAPWQAPAQTVGDFLADAAGNPSKTVTPSYARGVVWCDLREILPEFVTDAMAEAIPLFDRKLRGFADAGAVMTGVETRSSSPVRILRDDETLQAWRQEPPKRKVRARDIARGHGVPAEPEQPRVPSGIFPAGEGPGYAGGIMSAAVDGLRIAQAVARLYSDEPSADVANAGDTAADGGAASAATAGDVAVDGSAAAASAKVEAGRASLQDAARALQSGKPAVFPTDTVYGLGVSVEHCASPDVLFELKGRESSKPVAWLVDGPDALDRYGVDVSNEARELVRAHWPGALTVVVKAGPQVPEAFRSSEGTIGLRMPENDAALSLIRAVGCPLATTSANRSGMPSVSVAAELDDALTNAVATFAHDSQAGSGVASTVVDCTQAPFTVLRQGDLPINKA